MWVCVRACVCLIPDFLNFFFPPSFSSCSHPFSSLPNLCLYVGNVPFSPLLYTRPPLPSPHHRSGPGRRECRSSEGQNERKKEIKKHGRMRGTLPSRPSPSLTGPGESKEIISPPASVLEGFDYRGSRACWRCAVCGVCVCVCMLEDSDLTAAPAQRGHGEHSDEYVMMKRRKKQNSFAMQIYWTLCVCVSVLRLPGCLSNFRKSMAKQTHAIHSHFK